MDTMTTVTGGTRLSSAHAPWVTSAQMSVHGKWAHGAAGGFEHGAAAYRMFAVADRAHPATAIIPALAFAGHPASTSKIADQADHRGFDATVSTFSIRLGLSSGSPPV